MLQPFDPNSVDKNKHKFMVQTMFAPPDFAFENLDEVVSKPHLVHCAVCADSATLCGFFV